MGHVGLVFWIMVAVFLGLCVMAWRTIRRLARMRRDIASSSPVKETEKNGSPA